MIISSYAPCKVYLFLDQSRQGYSQKQYICKPSSSMSDYSIQWEPEYGIFPNEKCIVFDSLDEAKSFFQQKMIVAITCAKFILFAEEISTGQKIELLNLYRN